MIQTNQASSLSGLQEGEFATQRERGWESWQRNPESEFPAQPTGVNVGDGERVASVAAGAVLGVLGMTRKSVPGVIAALVGGALMFRGVRGHCPAYAAFDVDTSKDSSGKQSDRGIHVEEAFLINKPAEELYAYWRNLENLPSIMTHLKSVRVLDERRSHWVATAPRIAGGQVEWDAEITHDEPNSLIAWRSLPGADVDNAGSVRFAKAPGDRGTEVHAFISYVPPAGRLGKWAATLFGYGADHQIREGMRNFKRLMECGEVLTVEGQPRGSCNGTGVGKRQTK